MSMGLPNAKFGTGQPMQRLGLASRQYKVAPSIAEKAIFIPKPHDRVDFKLVMGGGKQAGQGEVPLMGGKSAPESIPLPGSGIGPKGENISAGELGANGVTARFGKSAWGGGSAGGQVEMVINRNPGKMKDGLSDPIPTQEEGRQVNNRQIHFSQQYDAYGRPRIGFSREPYDFAATKFVSITSQVDFQANMAKMHEHFDQYLLTGTGAAQPDKSQETSGEGDQSRQPVMGEEQAQSPAQPSVMGQEKIDSMSQPSVMGGEESKGFSEIPIFGSTSQDSASAEEGAGDSKASAEEAFESGSSSGATPQEKSSKIDSAYVSGKEKNPAGSLSVSA
ncbi:MAG: hypothetical protein HZB29_11630 [Nitrospinae bacterium]|nr:hypothetical protein [Nitrospinota bacterium]